MMIIVMMVICVGGHGAGPGQPPRQHTANKICLALSALKTYQSTMTTQYLTKMPMKEVFSIVASVQPGNVPGLGSAPIAMRSPDLDAPHSSRRRYAPWPRPYGSITAYPAYRPFSLFPDEDEDENERPTPSSSARLAQAPTRKGNKPITLHARVRRFFGRRVVDPIRLAFIRAADAAHGKRDPSTPNQRRGVWRTTVGAGLRRVVRAVGACFTAVWGTVLGLWMIIKFCRWMNRQGVAAAADDRRKKR